MLNFIKAGACILGAIAAGVLAEKLEKLKKD